MADRIFEAFLNKQLEEGMALAQSSALLELFPVPSEMPPQRYLASFSCQGLIQQYDGAVTEANHFEIGIWFPSEYLISVDSIWICTWLNPREIFHPNISQSGPFVCLGPIAPGTPLTELLYRIFEVITWNNFGTQEHNALNWHACQWARNNPDRYPVDRRPLKWNPLDGATQKKGRRQSE